MLHRAVREDRELKGCLDVLVLLGTDLGPLWEKICQPKALELPALVPGGA